MIFNKRSSALGEGHQHIFPSLMPMRLLSGHHFLKGFLGF
jgi:hypothetical protein